MTNASDVMAIMEQYQQEGGDMRAILDATQLLCATGKTSLGLNQWVKSDKPLMEDFNEDNRIIDAELRRLDENKMSGPWRFYSSLSELGIEPGQATVPNIVDRMQYQTSLKIVIGSNEVPDAYPSTGGILQIDKLAAFRHVILYTPISNNALFVGGYRNNGVWDGWRQAQLTLLPDGS